MPPQPAASTPVRCSTRTMPPGSAASTAAVQAWRAPTLEPAANFTVATLPAMRARRVWGRSLETEAGSFSRSRASETAQTSSARRRSRTLSDIIRLPD